MSWGYFGVRSLQIWRKFGDAHTCYVKACASLRIRTRLFIISVMFLFIITLLLDVCWSIVGTAEGDGAQSSIGQRIIKSNYLLPISPMVPRTSRELLWDVFISRNEGWTFTPSRPRKLLHALSSTTIQSSVSEGQSNRFFQLRPCAIVECWRTNGGA